MLKRLFRNEKGQGMVEYGLIIGLIAIIVLAVFIALGPQIKAMFAETVSNETVSTAQNKLETEMNIPQ
ncbi:Flp family type IVb pilin [bacterium]|nr:Flp family type IVb pilin [bacterium]